MQRRNPFSVRRLATERLEDRSLMAADISLSSHVLNVEGTNQNDEIVIENIDVQVQQTTLHRIQATIKNRDSGDVVLQKSFSAAAVDKIMVHCGAGDDFALNSTSKRSEMYGGQGFDQLNGGSGPDTLYAANSFDGADSSTTDPDLVNTLNGGDGIDVLYGSASRDILNGGGGTDTLKGGRGDDKLDGGDGKDSLFGGDGNDTLHGGNGDDALNGEKGNDMLFGGHDHDVLDGGDGDDLCVGGAGSDKIGGGAGFDNLIGDDQGDHDTSTADTFFFDALDNVNDEWWGVALLPFCPRQVVGQFKGSSVYTG